MSSFIKIRQVGAELSHADGDGRTDMTKLLFAFRNSAHAPKNAAKLLALTDFNIPHITSTALITVCETQTYNAGC